MKLAASKQPRRVRNLEEVAVGGDKCGSIAVTLVAFSSPTRFPAAPGKSLLGISVEASGIRVRARAVDLLGHGNRFSTTTLLRTFEELTSAEAGVEDVEDNNSNDDEDALKADKHALILDDRSVPALAQLSNTEGTSPQDEEDREGKSSKEGLELPGTAHSQNSRILVKSCGTMDPILAPDANAEVGSSGNKDAEGEDLEGKTSDHDVGPVLGRSVGA